MKFKKYILFITVMLLGIAAHAQQETMYTQYMNQLLSINPAYAGAKGVTSASIIAREQWTGWEGNPSTQTIYVHSPLNNETGVGASIVNDKIGPVSKTDIYGDYSYTITYPNKVYLSFGLKAGVSFYQAQLTNMTLTEPGDPSFAVDIARNFMPNAGVGVYLSSPSYYLGLAVPKLISNKITIEDVASGAVSKQSIHAFFMGGYVFDINRFFKFKPYFMVRGTLNSPLSIDLTGQFVIFERLWLGGTYRFGNAFGIMAQVKVSDQLKIGYAFDYTTTALSSYNAGGTHEVFIEFDFSFGRGRVRSPRYF
ncbi:MAG: type IX secretion system membrane protein PorP/SprF [Prolixibacteraceae bacterium]|nr:type IX secretion system membrane protein PorP/SprF [Prolixibacteraceae bacterium]